MTQAPTTEALTLEEVKRRIRIDFSDEDDDIGLLIESALDHVERYCGIVITQRTLEVKCDDWVDLARLPVAPVQSVASIAYIGADGMSATLTVSDYELRNDGLEVSIFPAIGKQWPGRQTGSRITVTLVAGFDAPPPAVKHAMLLSIAEFYENRENKPMSAFTAFDALLTNYRRGLT